MRTSRRLEVETHHNIEVIWLLRHLKPEFKTISDFRADNRSAFSRVLRDFVVLYRQLDLFGRELIAVDGTRIKAVNNKDRNFTRASLTTFIRAADERLADYMKRLDEGDAAEKATGGARMKNLAEKIEGLRNKRSEYDGLASFADLSVNKGNQTMEWTVSENGSVLMTDNITGARIEQKRQGPDMEYWSFYFTLCEPSRYFQMKREFKSKYLARLQDANWTKPQIFDPCLQLDADWLNWTCSQEEAMRLSTIYPRIAEAGQFERNSLLVEYVITGLIAKNRKWPFGNRPYSFFYSDFEHKKSMGKNYGYRLPLDDELLALMSASAT